MTKRQLIDEIVAINGTARPAFLAEFEDIDLSAYLQHLRVVQIPRIQRDPARYERYFASIVKEPVDSDIPAPSDPPQEPAEHAAPAGDAIVEEASGSDQVQQPVAAGAGSAETELWLY